MGPIRESDVAKLLQNPESMDHVVSGLVEDSRTMDTLAGDIADKIQDVLEDDSDLRQRVLNSAVANEAFRKKLVNRIIEELG